MKKAIFSKASFASNQLTGYYVNNIVSKLGLFMPKKIISQIEYRKTHINIISLLN